MVSGFEERSKSTGGPAAAIATVVIVDDDMVLCDLLAKRLDEEGSGFRCGGVASTPGEARRLVAQVQPDVILLDGVYFHNWWPDDDPRYVDPLDFAAELIALSDSSYLIIWTHWSDPSVGQQNEINLRLRAARAGAEALVLKGNGLEHLLGVIRTTLDKAASPRNHINTPMFEGIKNLISVVQPAREDIEDDLTPTERERAPKIARGLESGMKIPEIAGVLHLSDAGLRSTIRGIYRKWGVNNQTQFVSEARRRGYV
ncbi:MAG TPA: hypothetical protein VFX35_05585 [Solirubrobacterales bacterium]|nr:hypothetical protein [Solirubrobacterales bacterium]